MEALIDSFYFAFLECPNLKLKRPSWLQKPSPMVLFGIYLLYHFLITSGIIHDIINEPPSIGTTVDERGNSRPLAFMQRVNGQYIMEGLAGGFMFTLCAAGFVIMDQTHDPLMPKLNRLILIGVGFLSIVIGFSCNRLFLKMKLPTYLR